MIIQSPSRSRTNWTPLMERYFIDLTLEHIRKGNRIGHTFNKQAWTDMLTVFNRKFGSQYDKDVLKFRYTNLWKQFNDVKNLLEQKGFSWDKTREIVVADDYVWDAYIKIHPEVRPYKTKSILNFDDLRLIYGYIIADGRYSRSSHDVDVEDEPETVNFADGNHNLASSSSSRTEWTADMDGYFIELMLKQQKKGNKLENTFTKQAWTDMLALFNARFRFEYNKRALKRRYKEIRKRYGDLTALVKQKGFRWDEKRQIVVADDDAWDPYIEAHPHAKSYRSKVFTRYNNLASIFEGAICKESQSRCRQDQDIKDDAKMAKIGTGHSKTYWTRQMDHFLIDLMLEQVRGGNQIGHLFITQAWNDMVTSFNANFNSNFDREVLKNRYKQFRKQYNDVKIILRHAGFSWDEAREMVTAEDHIWDSYSQVLPYARLYRGKTVPCYHKLCIIYGEDKFDGSCSRSIGNIDPTVENPCTMIGNGKEEKSSIDWTLPMERLFIAMLLEQVHQGRDIDDPFDERDWAHMAVSFSEKFGMQFDQNILEKHYLSLMKHYFEISNILDQKGFLWDKSGQMIAADNHIWDLYIMENPDAISYQDKVLRHYNDLCVIFRTTGSVEQESSCELGMEFDRVDVHSEPLDQSKKRSAPTHPTAVKRCIKVQKIGEKKEQGDFNTIESVVAKLINKVIENNNCVVVENAIDALQAIRGVDDEILLDSCDLLEDEKKAKTFLALDATLRKKWLMKKLGRS